MVREEAQLTFTVKRRLDTDDIRTRDTLGERAEQEKIVEGFTLGLCGETRDWTCLLGQL